MSPVWTYTGCDIEPGDNVDLVLRDGLHLDTDGHGWDVLISGQCLEHVERPWELLPGVVKALRPGAWAFITAPWRWRVHRYPLDCWRILPDGMRVLLADAGLTVVETYIRDNDCWGIGRLPE